MTPTVPVHPNLDNVTAKHNTVKHESGVTLLTDGHHSLNPKGVPALDPVETEKSGNNLVVNGVCSVTTGRTRDRRFEPPGGGPVANNDTEHKKLDPCEHNPSGD